ARRAVAQWSCCASFSSAYGYRCALHCFPTRRSSDLGMNEYVVISGLSGAGRTTAGDVLEDRGWFVIDNLPVALIPDVAGLVPVSDRKSTRLNSSHVKISYAVFCLKKKNEISSVNSWG